MKLTIDSDIDRVFREVGEEYLGQVPFAASQAINRVAFTIAKERLPAETEKVFQGGSVRWTKRAFEYTRSSKRNLSAIVKVKDQNDYVNLQIEGGVFKPKGGKTQIQKTRHSRLTKQGNISLKMRKNYLKRKAFDNYFVGTPKGMNPETDYGLWQRVKRGKRQGLKMHMSMVRTPIKYRKKFRFYKFAKSQFYKDFEWQFARALVRAKAPRRKR